MTLKNTEDRKSEPKLTKEAVDNSVLSQQFGVWQFWTVKQSRLDPRRRWEELISGLHLFHRLAKEIFSISQGLLILFILSKLWGGVETAILMHLSSQLLQIIEAGLIAGHTDAYAIYSAIAARLTCLIFVATIQWWTDNTIPALKTRIMYYYEIHLMRAKLRLDIPTSQEPDSQARISAYDAWSAFEAIIEFLAELLGFASQLTLIIQASRSSGSPIFALLCVAKPLVHVLSRQNIWSLASMISSNNPHYKRMQALSQLTSDEYRQDYITGNLGTYILEEYEKARKGLGDTCTDDVWYQFDRRASPYFDIFSSISGDLPMVYCAINAVINPTRFSVASIAVLQQSSLTLRYSLESILYNVKSFQRHVSKLKNLYSTAEVKNKLQDGELSYPRPETEDKKGISFELRNVTFTYPGSKTKTNALNNVSISIKPGQLVVIVGANGSGKSTIIKLLTRLYDPTSGTILVDDVPTQQYRSSDLRQAMATFTQDHHIYPLSLYENIALGNPKFTSDAAMIKLASEQGGASEFINKLADGLDTVLDPMNDTFTINVPNDPDHPLQKHKEKLEKKVDISGGERQRVVASRTFMHLNSGHVKFVAVDEPSSALDAEGEHQLFEKLIASRVGKTMVFVTHRFGHLTKYADTIICMKDGTIVESGSHEILLKLGGEYAKLYNIQAKAFSGETDV